MNVAEQIVQGLRDQRVSHLFMDPGGRNDAFMVPMAGTAGVRTVVAAFEGRAAQMADGYARATGGLGACFGIGGPGVLNMVTALAQRDSQGSTQASSRRSPPTSLPAGRSDDARAVLEAVDAVVDTRSIPEDVQRRVVAAPGESGAVEIVALCGLYAIMGYMVTAFDIPIEEGFPSPPR